MEDSAALTTQWQQFICVGDLKEKKELGSFKREGIKEETGPPRALTDHVKKVSDARLSRQLGVRAIHSPFVPAEWQGVAAEMAKVVS